LYCTVAAAYVGTGGALNFARGYGPKAGRKPPSGREPIPFPDFAADLCGRKMEFVTAKQSLQLMDEVGDSTAYPCQVG
ncbi:MAG TPA: hypothetical protein VKM56_12225, partial [Verrucomicrobiae bacterium]|nr:hypothetical protein [Verrucomicrobiae bacterium]